MIEPSQINFGDNVDNRIMAAANNQKEKIRQDTTPKFAKEDPPHICIWPTRKNMEIWIFCMNTGTSQSDWINQYVKLFKREVDPNWFTDPLTHQIDYDKKIGWIPSPLILDNYSKTVEGKPLCQICWNLGISYYLKGKLLNEHLIPNKLGQTNCWCKR